MVRERERALLAECTFKPNIGEKVDRNLPPEERLKVLAAPKTEQTERRERQKRERQEDLEKSKCTFKPNITTKSRSSSSHSFSDFPERLYLDAGERKTRRERSQKDALDASASLYLSLIHI